jgi:hypothetical protein
MNTSDQSTEVTTTITITSSEAVPDRDTSPTPRPTLLGLPGELRILLYESVLLSPHSSNLDILLTCRQVNMEAEPVLYQRHATFSSQARLFDCIKKGKPSNLRRVQSLTIHLTDIDLSTLLGTQENSHEASSQPSPTTWSLYQGELDRLDHALTAIPNLNELVIIPPKGSRSQLLRGLYLSFLALIPRRYPKLKRLAIDDIEEVLGKVPALKELEKVDFLVWQGQPREASAKPTGKKHIKRERGMKKVKVEVESSKRKRRTSTAVETAVKRMKADVSVKVETIAR